MRIDVFAPDDRYLTDSPTASGADRRAFNESGTLWVVSRDQVTHYGFKYRRMDFPRFSTLVFEVYSFSD
jgi:hypothetical protein